MLDMLCTKSYYTRCNIIQFTIMFCWVPCSLLLFSSVILWRESSENRIKKTRLLYSQFYNSDALVWFLWTISLLPSTVWFGLDYMLVFICSFQREAFHVFKKAPEHVESVWMVWSFSKLSNSKIQSKIHIQSIRTAVCEFGWWGLWWAWSIGRRILRFPRCALCELKREKNSNVTPQNS